MKPLQNVLIDLDDLQRVGAPILSVIPLMTGVHSFSSARALPLATTIAITPLVTVFLLSSFALVAPADREAKKFQAEKRFLAREARKERGWPRLLFSLLAAFCLQGLTIGMVIYVSDLIFRQTSPSFWIYEIVAVAAESCVALSLWTYLLVARPLLPTT